MIEQNLEIPAADGLTEALLIRPESNDPLPAVINLTDGLGFRPAFAEQSKRIAERGYVVLTPNIFYRTSRTPVFPFDPDFGDERTRERFNQLKDPLTPVAMERDGSAYIDFLASQPFVSSGPMGSSASASRENSRCSLQQRVPTASPPPRHSTAADCLPTRWTARISSCLA